MVSDTGQTFRIYWRHVTKYPWILTLVLIGLCIGITGDSLLPIWYKEFFDILSVQGVSGYASLTGIIWKILATGGVIWVGWRIATFANNRFQPRVMADLLNTCFAYLHQHSYGFFSNNFTGSLVRRVNRYSRAFEDISDQVIWQLLHAALKLLIILFVLYQRNWMLSAVVLTWVLLYVGFSYWFAKFKLPYDVRQADADTRVTAQLADSLTNNANIKLFGGMEREKDTFNLLTQAQYKLRKLSWDLGTINEAVQGAFMVILEFALLYIALVYWRKGMLTVGDFVLVQTYMVQIFGRLWDMGRHIRRIYESLADAQEMTDILMTPHEIADDPNAKRLIANKGEIEFRNVVFGYQMDEPVFENFCLKIAAGERVAFIGPSGGGKTTIVKLLLRFHDIDDGNVLIDGQDISKVSQESLRASIAMVPQEPILFHRSLMENIRYARLNATNEEVIAAAGSANAHEFISSFPQGYDTYVGERGVKLSGGERQRVAIARAVLKNAPILVLDEATSSLDSESERLIQDALMKLMKGRTTIVIAHRLSTIMQMDRIVVIEQGAIREQGKHKELLKVKKGLYQRLWDIQAGGFVRT